MTFYIDCIKQAISLRKRRGLTPEGESALKQGEWDF